MHHIFNSGGGIIYNPQELWFILAMIAVILIAIVVIGITGSDDEEENKDDS